MNSHYAAFGGAYRLTEPSPSNNDSLQRLVNFINHCSQPEPGQPQVERFLSQFELPDFIFFYLVLRYHHFEGAAKERNVEVLRSIARILLVPSVQDFSHHSQDLTGCNAILPLYKVLALRSLPACSLSTNTPLNISALLVLGPTQIKTSEIVVPSLAQDLRVLVLAPDFADDGWTVSGPPHLILDTIPLRKSFISSLHLIFGEHTTFETVEQVLGCMPDDLTDLTLVDLHSSRELSESHNISLTTNLTRFQKLRSLSIHLRKPILTLKIQTPRLRYLTCTYTFMCESLSTLPMELDQMHIYRLSNDPEPRQLINFSTVRNVKINRVNFKDDLDNLKPINLSLIPTNRYRKKPIWIVLKTDHKSLPKDPIRCPSNWDLECSQYSGRASTGVFALVEGMGRLFYRDKGA